MSPSYYPGIGNLYTVASVKGGDIYILNTLDLYVKKKFSGIFWSMLPLSL